MDGQQTSEGFARIGGIIGTVFSGTGNVLAQTVITGPLQDISTVITIVAGLGTAVLVWRAVWRGEWFRKRGDDG